MLAKEDCQRKGKKKCVFKPTPPPPSCNGLSEIKCNESALGCAWNGILCRIDCEKLLGKKGCKQQKKDCRWKNKKCWFK